MLNYKQNILAELKGEPVEAIVIGKWDDDEEDERNPREIEAITGKVISWEEAEKWLDYEYDTGYGGTDCHPVIIWTATRVLFCGTYDGSTWVASVPRHPEECNPGFVGG